jgi:predicted DsbA family dithiol-disulfide isomerase
MWKMENFPRSVRSQVEEVVQIGITGPPTSAIDERYAIVGTQPFKIFVRALKQAEQETGVQFQKEH